MLSVEIKQGNKVYTFWGVKSIRRSANETSIILFFGDKCFYVHNAIILNVFVSGLDFSYTDESAKKILH